MAHYLVTGGAGFIGSHLCEELVRRGERVRVVDSLITGKRQNLAHLPQVEGAAAELGGDAAAAVRGLSGGPGTGGAERRAAPLGVRRGHRGLTSRS